MMKHLLFVDDEPKVLDGFRRSLRSMRHEWDMTFVTSGEEALTTLAQAPFDVVVSDMRMPGMDGAQLMNEVQGRYAHIARIILSGHSGQEMIFQSISASHQYLAKPCDIEQLRAAIQRAYALREVLKNDTLQGLVAGMRTIPSMPTIFMEIKKEAESRSSSLKTIGQIVSKDIGMTARLLQLVNSAYFGLRRDVSTVEQAVNILGLDTLQALVLSVQVFSQFEEKRAATQFHFERLWKDSLNVAMLARSIAKAEQCPLHEMERAYTAGLLHDVGILVLATNLADRYGVIIKKASDGSCEVWNAEQSEFGTTHAEVGAYLLGLWGLGDPIVQSVAYHHRPGDCPGEIFSPLTAVYVANVLQQECSQQATENVSSKLDMAYLDKLRLTDRLPHWRELAGVLSKEQAND